MAGYGGETDTGFNRMILAGRRNTVNKRALSPPEQINQSSWVGATERSLYSSSATEGKGAMLAPREVHITTSEGAPAAVSMKLNSWSADTTKDANPIYLQFIVPSKQTAKIPMSRILAAPNVATVLDGSALAQAAPDSNMYIDSTADADSATAAGVVGHATNTTLYLEPYTSADNCTANMFRVGDLVRIRDEVMEVTAIGDKSNLANNYLTVIRGVHGSSAGTAAVDDDPVRLTFFNAYHNFTAATGGYDVPQTDNNGRFAATNFFGYGRAATYQATGILPGSVSIKFYNPGYQELGLSGITAGTDTGLTAGGSYWLKIAIDGGTAESINFTVDASNTNFGGRNGVLGKIQDVLDEKYYNPSANIFEQRATVGIVGGDVRFTSGSHLSTSAIALTAGVDGASAAYNIFAQQNGRFPILAKIATAVAAALPDNTLTSRETSQAFPNTRAFLYDDGDGNLVGNGVGTIDYDSGAVSFTSAPNAEFVVSARYGSGLAGNVSTSSNNTIEDISVRSTNDSISSKVSLNIWGYYYKEKLTRRDTK